MHLFLEIAQTSLSTLEIKKLSTHKGGYFGPRAFSHLQDKRNTTQGREIETLVRTKIEEINFILVGKIL